MSFIEMDFASGGSGGETVKYHDFTITLAGQDTATIDIKNIFSEYKNMSIDNIIVQFQSIKAKSSNGAVAMLEYSYDSVNGIITIKSSTVAAPFGNMTGNVVVRVYVTKSALEEV